MSSRLLSFVILGGKWTTYRSMAQETVDEAIKVAMLSPKSECSTLGLLLEGAHCYSPTMFINLVQDYGLENEVRIGIQLMVLRSNVKISLDHF